MPKYTFFTKKKKYVETHVDAKILNNLFQHLKKVSTNDLYPKPKKEFHIPFIANEQTFILKFELEYDSVESRFWIRVLAIDSIKNVFYYILADENKNATTLISYLRYYLNNAKVCKKCLRLFCPKAYPIEFNVQEKMCLNCQSRELSIGKKRVCTVCNKEMTTNYVLAPCKHYMHYNCALVATNCKKCNANIRGFIMY